MPQGPTQFSNTTRRRSRSEFLPAAMFVVSVLIVVCALLTLGFTFYPEWTRLTDMKDDLVRQKTHLEDLQRLATDRHKEIRLLQEDPAYLETIARDRMDLMKSGETIFRLSAIHPHS